MTETEKAWAAFEIAFRKWKDSLPNDSELLDADLWPDQLEAFFAAHPDGWQSH